MAIGTPVAVGNTTITGSSPTSITFNTTANIPAGARVFVCMTWVRGDGTDLNGPATMTLSGVTLTKDAGFSLTPGGSAGTTAYGFNVWSGIPVAQINSGTALTGGWGGSTASVPHLYAFYCTGVAAASYVDGTPLAAGVGTGTTTWTSGGTALTTSNADDLLVGLGFGDWSAATGVQNTPTGTLSNELYDLANADSYGFFVDYAIVGSTGSYTATGTLATSTNFAAGGMIIAYKAAAGGGSSTGEVSYVAAGTAATATSGNVTPAYPAGIAADDILVCEVSSQDNVSCTFGGSGWTIKSQLNSGTLLRQTIAWKRRASGDSDTDVVITHSAGGRIVARVHALRNCKKNGDPFETHNAAAPTAAATGTFPTVTTTLPNDLMLYALSYGNDFTTGPAITNAQGLTLTERDETEVT